ncbi:MAG: hypothetical protein M1838_004437 [Thelocarpon superellum]|nr:MAG: hypothetical protein M1838_004437 [Thelocarpon superellum]
MPTKLKPLLLPQLVEARRSEESKERFEFDCPDFYASFHTPKSTSSDIPSPVTPTFSLRGFGRYDSPASSVDVTTFPPFPKEFPSPPSVIDALETYQLTLRSLPDVKEEPLEREEDAHVYDDSAESYDCPYQPSPSVAPMQLDRSMAGQLSLDQLPDFRDETLTLSSVALAHPESCDLADGFTSDNDTFALPYLRKRSSSDSPMTGIASRLGRRLPSFAPRWKGKKAGSAAMPDARRECSRSGPSSSRTSSMTQSVVEMSDRYEIQYPPTPSSILSEHDETPEPSPLEMDEDEEEDGKEKPTDSRAGQATTPLLPPLMVLERPKGHDATPTQSPLQSPTVADGPEPFSLTPDPREVPCTPQTSGMPSPPLSTKPSMSSLRHRANAHLVPSHEIPSIRLADPDDHWARTLGHANFDIHPAPYAPDVFDVEACRQIRANWELARCNFTKHLVRTGEHYGVTSKTYKLTEEKWNEIDALWRKNRDLAISAIADEDEKVKEETLRETTPDATTTTVVEIPWLNDPRCEGKFPKLGDEVIVGPMVQIASQLQPKLSKKASLLKLIHDVKLPPIPFSRSWAERPAKSWERRTRFRRSRTIS